jgi:hypothetical protein
MEFTFAWVLWGVAFAVIEGIALFNSKRGDTLSEHVWAFIGVRDRQWRLRRDYWVPEPKQPTTPVWTLRLARIALISGMVWLVLHFVTGGWV